MSNFFWWGGAHPFLFVWFVLVVGTILHTAVQAVRRR